MGVYGLDTETTGLCGQINTVQFGTKERQIIIRPYRETRKMMQFFSSLYDEKNTFFGYNIGFDLNRLYCMAHVVMSKMGIKDVSEYDGKEIRIKPDDFKAFVNKDFKPFIYPFQAHFIDLMLHVKTEGEYAPFAQSLSDSEGGRKKSSTRCISRLKKVHSSVKEEVANRVLSELDLPQGVIVNVSYEKREKDWYDIKFMLSFSAKLKSLVSYIKKQETIKMDDFGWNFVKNEKQYDPFFGYYDDEAIRLFDENEKIVGSSDQFSEYAKKDISYLFDLSGFLGNVTENDNDKVTHIIAYTRYHGFELDNEGLSQYENELYNGIEDVKKEFPEIDIASSEQKIIYLNENGIKTKSSSVKHLSKILSDLNISKKMEECGFDLDMPNNEKIIEKIKVMMRYGAAYQRWHMAHVLNDTATGRLHPDLKAIGTASGRMAGTGKFNVQGIPKENDGIRKYIRTSMGGDYGGQELSVAAFVYNDENMEKDIRNKFDLHLNVITPLVTHTYDELVKIKKDVNHPEHKKIKGMRNNIGKKTNFCTIYGGGKFRVIMNLKEENIQEPEIKADEMLSVFTTRYVGFKTFTDKLSKKFVTLAPIYEAGRWGEVSNAIQEMGTSITNALGFTRFWSFEKKLIDVFINCNIDRNLSQEKVVRNTEKGTQTVSNAVKSACLGAALGIQRGILRQAANHQVQSLGSCLTKKLMIRVWENHMIPILNIHDEIIVPSGIEDTYDDVKKTVNEEIEEQRKLVSTLTLDFIGMQTWSEKE